MTVIEGVPEVVGLFVAAVVLYYVLKGVFLQESKEPGEFETVVIYVGEEGPKPEPTPRSKEEKLVLPEKMTLVDWVAYLSSEGWIVLLTLFFVSSVFLSLSAFPLSAQGVLDPSPYASLAYIGSGGIGLADLVFIADAIQGKVVEIRAAKRAHECAVAAPPPKEESQKPVDWSDWES